MDTQHQSKQEMGSLSHIKETLQPLLQSQAGSQEYVRQFKEMKELLQQFRSVEAAYAATYSRVTSLEKKIATYRQSWQASTL